MSKSNNTVKEAVLDAQKLKETIKEESKDTLRQLFNEAVKDVIRESVKEDDEDYEVVDDNDNKPADGAEKTPAQEPVNAEGTPAQEPAPAETEPAQPEADDDWSAFSEYQTGDENTYDLTNLQDNEKILTAFKKMNPTDKFVVTQDGSQIHLKDNEDGDEYIIELGMDGETVEDDGETMDMTEGVIKEFNEDGREDIAGIPTEPVDDGDEDLSDLELSDEPLNNEPVHEGKKNKKVMKENKEMIFEVDLGYMDDDYQDKDPIQGLSNTEPSKSGKSWDKVPTGTDKPWAGDSKSKGEPFGKTVDEQVDECGDKKLPVQEPIVDENVTVVKNNKRKSPKTKSPDAGEVDKPEVSRHVSVGADYKDVMEAYVKENKQLKKAVSELKKAMNEAYIVNTNLAKITRLFTENTVSQNEKKEIVNRFATEAKTLEQSQSLYESIDKQLKKNQNLTLESSKSMSVQGSSVINEGKVTYKSQDLLNTLDLIKRMNNC